VNDLLAAGKTLFELAEKTPVAVRAVRIFGEHVLKGEGVKEALVKTGEILALEALI